MKKIAVFLFTLVFASLGLFAQRSFVESDKIDRMFDAKAQKLVDELKAKQDFLFEVGKDTQKEIPIGGTYKKFAIHTSELNMGLYDLFFSKVNGKLKVEAKLQEGVEEFPPNILVFRRKQVEWTRNDPSTNYEMDQTYFLEMDLLTATGEFVTTYTLGMTW